MKIKKLLVGATVTSLTLFAISGCATAPEPEKTPEEVLNQGLENLSKATSAGFDLAFNADLKDEDGVNMKMNLKLNGALDVTDEKDSKMILNLDGTVNSEEMKGSAKLNFMLDKDNVYFNLAGLDLGEIMPIPDDLKTYMGKWYSYALPEGTSTEMMDSLDMPVDMEEFSELWTDNAPEYDGSESVAGDPSWRYKLNIDEEFIGAMTDGAVDDFSLDGANIDAYIWVSSTTNAINQFKLSADKTATEEDKSSGTFSFVFTLSNVNKPVSVKAPSGVSEFPLEQFMEEESVAPLMMLMLGGGDMMYDDYDYDYDFDDEEWELLFDEEDVTVEG